MEPAANSSKKLLAVFLRRLTNLSGNNRSLFLRGISDRFIDLQGLSQLNGQKSFSIIEALLQEKKMMICPVADSRMESANEASLNLKRLLRLDQFTFEESGARDLHVGWPFVQGKFSDGTGVRCPLLFFPVELKIENANWDLCPREEILFNKSFLLAYSFFNKTKVDDSLLEETFEEVNRDGTAFRTELYRMLQSSTIELNFNPDTYQDELINFASYTKKQFDESHAVGSLKLFPEAVLGIFPQAGSSLVQDYVQLIEENSFQDTEDFFAGRGEASTPRQSDNFTSLVKEEKIYSVFPSDIWQENALKASKLGHSIVVQGPPGTGKSQLIGNLVSDAMANGKRVLVVCQKRAALDVVYGRLKEKNLINFLALVHDYKNDRKEIFEKVSAQINLTDEYKSKNISLDAIQLDRKFLQTSKRIDHITEELEHFRQSLFDESECGRSVKELYLQCSYDNPFILLKQEYSHFKFDQIDHVLRSIRQYATYANQFENDSYLLRDRKSFAKFSVGDLPEIKSVINEVFPFYQEISQSLVKNLNASLDLDQLKKLGDRINDLRIISDTIAAKQLYPSLKKMLPEKSNETSLLWLSNIERMMMDCFSSDGPEASVPASLLGHFQKALHRGMKARKGLWSWLRWQLFSKDKIMITRALVANQLQSDKAGFEILEKKLDQRLNFEHNLSKLRNKKWLINIPEIISKEHFAEWFEQQREAIKIRLLFGAIRGFKNLLNPIHLREAEFKNKMQALIQVLVQTQDKVNHWSSYLSISQLNNLSSGRIPADELAALVAQDFDSLCEFDKLREALSENELQIITKLKEKSTNIETGEWQQLFLNSLCLAWIDHIETKHPELRIVSSGKMNALESELREQIEIKQSLSEEILLLRARERATDNLEFNRLNNRISYRDLLHQTTKKKKIWPLRKVVSEFEDEIFKLIPCWLASPESVSAIFSMKEIFDLVIFDEASQCFAERGIPALYRGKQAVIAGDSKQLRPGDFYLARWQDEEFEGPDAEVDSLLELTSRYLMTVKLNGHYRSQSLELIDFSNKHFYEGRLQLLPDFNQINKLQPAIEYNKVSGIWKNNSNEVEARHIADIVLKISKINPTKEIGIVTFNAIQQSLVLDCLEEKFAEGSTLLPERLFVKNIENVQGDERDIIIFSIGYAPDDKGKVSVQFGSLNMDGGENRLNVAVSRAREKIIVVSSLWPEQLEVGETKNAGPKLLKEYLRFARQVSDGDFHPHIVADKKYSEAAQLKFQIEHLAAKSGIVLKKNVFPFYDLAVQKANVYKGAIFTDDNFYHESLSAKASHALLPQLLKKKNWPNIRVYSRNYWNDKRRLENDLKEFD